jgi:hypothetical protein
MPTVRSSDNSPAYLLPDGGAVRFFKYDKPSEFYGTQACLVRNRTAQGIFLVRVPLGASLCHAFQYKDLFESRQSAENRDLEYKNLAPYIHEREVGINCGQLASGAEGVDVTPGPGLLYHGTPIIAKDTEGNSKVRIPFAGDKVNCPTLIENPHDYLGHTVDGYHESAELKDWLTIGTVGYTNDDAKSDSLGE